MTVQRAPTEQKGKMMRRVGIQSFVYLLASDTMVASSPLLACTVDFTVQGQVNLKTSKRGSLYPIG